jgi:3-oxoacyl-[acyl-carrier protein] reductase
MELAKKVAVVTGAAQGIGKTIAVCLAEKGASLVVCDINLKMASETAREIETAGGSCLMKEEQWDQVMAVNLKGTFNCTKAAIKLMLRQKRGTVINIASITGLMGNPGQANYSASKAGVIGFTKAVAREYAERGITVNAVAPGFIATAMTDAIPEKEREALIKQIPLQRLGTPLDVAHAVCFLASEQASYITGQVIGVNGGLYM